MRFVVVVSIGHRNVKKSPKQRNKKKKIWFWCMCICLQVLWMWMSIHSKQIYICKCVHMHIIMWKWISLYSFISALLSCRRYKWIYTPACKSTNVHDVLYIKQITFVTTDQARVIPGGHQQPAECWWGAQPVRHWWETGNLWEDETGWQVSDENKLNTVSVKILFLLHFGALLFVFFLHL